MIVMGIIKWLFGFAGLISKSMFKVSGGTIEQYDFKIEINSLKDVIIKRLQDENATLRERCSKLEQRPVVFESSTNYLEQYGRRNDIVISGIPDSADINH